MENTRRKEYDATFKLKVINLAVEGNRAAARKLGITEPMVRRWRRQQEELSQCKKTTKAFRGNHSRWSELENFLEDWLNTRRASSCSVSTVQIRLKAKTIATEMKIEDFRAEGGVTVACVDGDGVGDAAVLEVLPVLVSTEELDGFGHHKSNISAARPQQFGAVRQVY
uniref:HTH psq-type domain-containing protein n=1 Tax=Octopus bimaculoides TaxID=37653 RepID=A0A0L8HXD2_OCTBM